MKEKFTNENKMVNSSREKNNNNNFIVSSMSNATSSKRIGYNSMDRDSSDDDKNDDKDNGEVDNDDDEDSVDDEEDEEDDEDDDDDDDDNDEGQEFTDDGGDEKDEPITNSNVTRKSANATNYDNMPLFERLLAQNRSTEQPPSSTENKNTRRLRKMKEETDREKRKLGRSNKNHPAELPSNRPVKR